MRARRKNLTVYSDFQLVQPIERRRSAKKPQDILRYATHMCPTKIVLNAAPTIVA